MANKNIITVLSFFLLVTLVSCKKYLDEKPDAKLSTIDNLEDAQQILDNMSTVNMGMSGTNTSTDEYYILSADWSAFPADNYDKKNAYVWQPNTQDKTDWNNQYIAVLYANTVLDHLVKIPQDGQQQNWNNIKGQALFFRAHSFFQVSQLYAKDYDQGTATSDLGIPLRLTSDFNVPTTRPTQQETYAQIIQDLENSLPLLPDISIYQNRPCRAAAFALLARTYLIMGDYNKTLQNANSSLQLYSTLMNFNNPNSPDFVMPTSNSTAIKKFNIEIIFWASTTSPINSSSIAKIDSTLYNSFSVDDMRKTVFFRSNGNGTYRFKGSYNSGSADLFSGIATDEVYLMRAEANARLGNTAAAMQDLNTLLIKRWKTGLFVPFTAANAQDALSQILSERKKELIYRGIRWPDIKRLNRDGSNITLTRIINGQPITLAPNDKRYALLIPQDVINLSGIQQNPR